MRNHVKRIQYRPTITARLIAYLIITSGISIFSLLVLLLDHVQKRSPKIEIAVVLCVLTVSFLCYYYIVRPISRSERLLKKSVAEYKGDLPEKGCSSCSFDEALAIILIHQSQTANKTLSLEYLRKEAELNYLQSQINPHFLYNTLESIRGLALSNQDPDVAEIVEYLAALFRNMTKKSDTLILFREELQNARNYVKIQQLRFRGKFEYVVPNDDQFSELLSMKVPNLILQPIIENSISHGFESVISGGRITLSAYCTQSRLIITVTDNGQGIRQESLEEINRWLADPSLENEAQTRHTSIALSNISQRIKYQFGAQYGITLTSTQEIGTEVSFSLPIIR